MAEEEADTWLKLYRWGEANLELGSTGWPRSDGQIRALVKLPDPTESNSTASYESQSALSDSEPSREPLQGQEATG